MGDVAQGYRRESTMASRFVRLYNFLATSLLSSLILVVGGHYFLELYNPRLSAAKVDPHVIDIIDPRAYQAMYANHPERDTIFEYARHDRIHFEPYIHWRRYPIETKHVHVNEQGIRTTIKRPNPQAKKVFVLGGSTVWGIGASDDRTIPSFLQQALGGEYDVYNFGETGYVATQELNQLLRKLADGDIPDYVIFYDGNNDGYAGAYSPAVPRDPQNLRQEAAAREQAEDNLLYRVLHEWIEPSNYAKLLWSLQERRVRLWDDRIAEGAARRAKQVVGYYEAHVRQVQALAKEYGFKAYFFWQANMFNPRRTPVAYEQDILKSASPVFIETQRQVYYEAKRAFEGRESDGIYFLADLFNEVAEPVFLDWSHTSMEGNKIVADKIIDSLQPVMRR